MFTQKKHNNIIVWQINNLKKLFLANIKKIPKEFYLLFWI